MPRPTDHVAKAAVIADYKAGLSGNDAATRHGVSTSTAHKWITSAGISRSLSTAARQRAGQKRDEEFGLTGGRWVNDRGVQRWVDGLPEQPVAELASVDSLIACPTCRARVNETCRTTSGHTTTPHGSRLTPRLCACGASLKSRRRLCDPCRDESLRVSKRDHGRRKRLGEVAA